LSKILFIVKNILQPMPVPRRKTGGSSPSDSDLTPDDQSTKDLTSVGVKLQNLP
jgi:hypothetical protein